MHKLLQDLDEKPRWFIRRRFALATWPAASAALLTAFDPALSLVPMGWSLAVLGRILYRLPHEQRWLRQATQEIEAAEWELAISRLRRPPRLCGLGAWIRAQCLLAIAYLEKSDALSAWQVLNHVDDRDLMNIEWQRLTETRAWLYHEVGNIRDFLACTDSLPDKITHTDHWHAMLKGLAHQKRGDFEAAREALERALELAQTPKHYQQLYNNLAVLAGLQEQDQEQLRLLHIAMRYLREAPTGGMLAVIPHNLAFSLLHDEQPEAARDAMREARQLSDKINKQQILEILNTSLSLAREACDEAWKAEVYEHNQTLLANMPSLSASEKVALKVNQLRMARNDGVTLTEDSYLDHVVELASELYHLNEQEKVAALCAIFHDIGCELEDALRVNAHHEAVLLSDLLYQTGALLESKRQVIDAQLESIPPTLVLQHRVWLNYRHVLTKAAVMRKLDNSEEYPATELRRILTSLQEIAQLYQEKRADSEAIEAWLTVLDEYIAYKNQLKHPQWQQRLEWEWGDAAKQALTGAVTLMESQPHWRGIEDKMIALAYFSLKLNADSELAQKWLDHFDNTECSLQHFSEWLREQYHQVKAALS